ncbi:DUF4232 domain-containing protein [Paraburkholderia sp. BCC1886]|uniref:DUF4232 domain-containing protein n=1 Tax=Paraburkholderia sp. BCC1886 TaxID=2562670 RepID=UPI0021B44408|nr:DUF4232 domain-containing protein [Paraburkholderia sp. BCC1886]
MQRFALLVVMLLGSQSISFAAAPVAPPVCRASQLRLSLDGRDGEFNGMSHSGVELSIRNVGPDCRLSALPTIQFRDAKGRVLAAARRPPAGMHPGPVMVPVRLGGGHRGVIDLRWVSGPVFPGSRSVRAATVVIRIGTGTLRAPLAAELYGATGQPVAFEQQPLHAVEGMAAD